MPASTPVSTPILTLLASLSRLAALQRDTVDRLALQEAVAAANSGERDGKILIVPNN